MRGRPRKIYLESETPVTTTVRISKSARDKLPADVNISRFLEAAILSTYGDKSKAAIEEQRRKVRDLEIELARAKLVLAEMEAALENEEKIRKALRMDEEYAIRAFMRVTTRGEKGHLRPLELQYLEKYLSTDKIIEWYGIDFDRNAFLRDYDNFEDQIVSGTYDLHEFREKYKVRLVRKPGTPQEKDIMKQLEDEYGV